MLLSVSPIVYSSSMEREPSSSNANTNSSNLQLPPGFRFHPSDQELIVHYLLNKVTSRPLPASFITEVNLYKYNPWELPKKAAFGEGEWYFFSPRDRKYPKGKRPNRAAGLGYWKATGIDKPIFSSSGLSKAIGVKKSLVFYTGRPLKGEKTDWFMNEYRLPDSSISPPGLKGSMRLDDWVLCRVRCKGNTSKNTRESQHGHTSEATRYLPEPEQDSFAHANRDKLITDYMDKDCVLLAWILSGQPVTPMETIPRADFEGSNHIGNLSSFYEDGSNRVNCQIVSSMDNCFNLLNGETSEKKDEEHIDSKKSNEDNVCRESLAETDIWRYIQNQSPDDMYNINFNY